MAYLETVLLNLQLDHGIHNSVTHNEVITKGHIWPNGYAELISPIITLRCRHQLALLLKATLEVANAYSYSNYSSSSVPIKGRLAVDLSLLMKGRITSFCDSIHSTSFCTAHVDWAVVLWQKANRSTSIVPFMAPLRDRCGKTFNSILLLCGYYCASRSIITYVTRFHSQRYTCTVLYLLFWSRDCLCQLIAPGPLID